MSVRRTDVQFRHGNTKGLDSPDVSSYPGKSELPPLELLSEVDAKDLHYSGRTVKFINLLIGKVQHRVESARFSCARSKTLLGLARHSKRFCHSGHFRLSFPVNARRPSERTVKRKILRHI